jgi:hypothetical protein
MDVIQQCFENYVGALAQGITASFFFNLIPLLLLILVDLIFKVEK